MRRNRKAMIRLVMAILIVLPSIVMGEADWLWHDNNRVPSTPKANAPVELWVKIGYQYYVDNAAIYYSTDDDPTGSRGVPANGAVREMFWSHLEYDEGAGLYADWWKGELPGFPVGAEVRYRIGAWSSAGGEERFADNNATASESADIFSYRITEGATSQLLVGDSKRVSVEPDLHPVPADLEVEVYTDLDSPPDTRNWRGIPLDSDGDDRYYGYLIPTRTGLFNYCYRYRSEASAWTYTEGDPDDINSMAHIVAGPAWAADAVFYQVFPRVHNATDKNGNGQLDNDEFGGFREVAQDLDRMLDLGINVLWLMPVHPLSTNPAYIKSSDGGPGSPYAPKDYRAVNPDYGTEDDLRSLIYEAHSRDMKVVLGFVPNHVSPDCVILDPDNPPENGGYHKDWFVLDERGNPIPDNPDWSDTAAWNYDCADGANLYKYVAESIDYWVAEFDVDGFRCDFAHWQPVDFWRYAINLVMQRKENVLFLAEAFELETELESAGFATVYNFDTYNFFKDMAAGRQDAAALRDHLDWLKNRQLDGFLPFRYAENHDEERAAQLWGDSDRAKPHVAFTFLTRAVPSIYAGQESGESARIPLFKGWWSLEEYPVLDFKRDPMLTGWYRELIELRASAEVIRRGDAFPVVSANNCIYAEARRRGTEWALTVFNFDPSGLEAQTTLALPVEEMGMSANAGYFITDLRTGSAVDVLGYVLSSYSVTIPGNDFLAFRITQSTGETPTFTPTPICSPRTPTPPLPTRTSTSEPVSSPSCTPMATEKPETPTTTETPTHSAPTLSISLNKTEFSKADTMKVFAGASNPGPELALDIYIAVEISGRCYFWPEYNELIRGVRTSLEAGLEVSSALVAEIRLTEIKGPLEGTWFIAGTAAGTLDVLTIGKTAFTISE